MATPACLDPTALQAAATGLAIAPTVQLTRPALRRRAHGEVSSWRGSLVDMLDDAVIGAEAHAISSHLRCVRDRHGKRGLAARYQRRCRHRAAAVRHRAPVAIEEDD